MGGSSPRVRGKHRRRICACEKNGLIPARAGKTAGHRAASHWSTAHPRACGENDPASCRSAPSAGSSPRVRGKLAVVAGVAANGGLIPARAGKTTPTHPSTAAVAAHPRACGENQLLFDPFGDPGGSSPRVRGKQAPCGSGEHPPRLIPARAGKTRVARDGHRVSPAHPRACGENAAVRQLSGATAGSSPRVRGKRAVVVQGAQGVRLIPARAGKTRGSCSGRAGRSAHPRACGENMMTSAARRNCSGSSPRVRGKLPRGRNSIRKPGLIPARAGKTAAPRSSS